MPLGPQWRAVQREAQLAAAQTTHGITVLGRANHAQPGLYTQAFFALSIGLERIGKLIFLADHAITNDGDFPTDQDLKNLGHNLSSLLPKCEAIGRGLDPDRQYADRPSTAIHQAIEEVLSLFATKLRYYNLNHLVGADDGQEDPVAMWWSRVAALICEQHYSRRQREEDEADSRVAEGLQGGHSIVLHSTETGDPIRDIETFWARGGATQVVQRYGRLYTLQIVRWLTSMMFKLSHKAADGQRIESFFGSHEPFAIFLNEDSFLLDRDIWSIYPE